MKIALALFVALLWLTLVIGIYGISAYIIFHFVAKYW